MYVCKLAASSVRLINFSLHMLRGSSTDYREKLQDFSAKGGQMHALFVDHTHSNSQKDRTAYMKFTRSPPPILQLFMGVINFVNNQNMNVWELLWIYILTLSPYLLFGVKQVESSGDSAGCVLKFWAGSAGTSCR